MNVEQVTDDIVNQLIWNISDFEERTLAKQIISDILSEVDAAHENEIEALNAEIDMYRGPDEERLW